MENLVDVNEINTNEVRADENVNAEAVKTEDKKLYALVKAEVGGKPFILYMEEKTTIEEAVEGVFGIFRQIMVISNDVSARNAVAAKEEVKDVE